MGRRILTEAERKDLARYTKRLRYNPDTQKDYWEIVKDGKEVVMFRNSYWEEGSNKPYFRLYDKGNQQQAQD